MVQHIVCMYLMSDACAFLLIAGEGPRTKMCEFIHMIVLLYDKLANLQSYHTSGTVDVFLQVPSLAPGKIPNALVHIASA